jgi:hypothetical protein
MNPKKAFRKFGDACMNAPEGASLTIGLTWIEAKGWRVMMSIHTSVLMVGAKDARGLADVYDKQHRSPEYLGKTTGLEWVAPMLRELADEADQKNRDRVMPPEMLEHVSAANTMKA